MDRRNAVYAGAAVLSAGAWWALGSGWLAAGATCGCAVILVAAALYRRTDAKEAGPPKSAEERRGQVLSILAVLMFIAGTFTWRGRTASELSSTPVDSAATVRIAADLLAIALVFFAVTVKGRPPLRPSSPRSWYLLYIVVVVLGATAAVDPQLVLFRVFDLAVALAVGGTLAMWCTLPQIIRLCRRVLLAISAVVLAEAVAMPGLALVPARGGIVPFRLEGVFPIVTYNSVGAYGVMLFALGLAVAEGRRLAVPVGLLMVALSQYRTGYLAVAAVLIVYLIARRGALQKLALVAAIPVGLLLVQSALFQSAWNRGEEASDSVGTLSGRTDYWAAAFQVAERSPIIGTGLSSGTRFEAFRLIGNETASTIHGTWVEAYLGTGILGTLMLAGFVLASLAWAWRTRGASLAALLLIVSVLVRSTTGTTIELAGLTLVLVLAVTIKVGERDRPDPKAKPVPPTVSSRGPSVPTR